MGIVHDSRYVESTEASCVLGKGAWRVQLCQAERQKTTKEWIMLWRLAIRNAKVSWWSSGTLEPEMANSNTLYVKSGINIP